MGMVQATADDDKLYMLPLDRLPPLQLGEVESMSLCPLRAGEAASHFSSHCMCWIFSEKEKKKTEMGRERKD